MRKDFKIDRVISYILLSIGLVFLLLKTVFTMNPPEFIFGWPFVILMMGLLLGFYTRFSHPLIFILISIGLIFTFTINMPLPYGEIWFPALLATGALVFGIKSKLRNKRPHTGV